VVWAPAFTVAGDIKFFESIDAPIVTVAQGAIAGGGMGYVWAADITVAAAGITTGPHSQVHRLCEL